jgi:predicted N-acetyltransferase YhbS
MLYLYRVEFKLTAICPVDSCDLVLIETADDQAAYHRIRRLVLFDGKPDYVTDGPEEVKKENLSLLLKYQQEPIGTVRLDQRQDGKAIVRLVAIASDLQKQGHGIVLMDRLEKPASSVEVKELLVHAVHHAFGFYKKLGYSPFSFEVGDFQSVQLHKLI